MPSIFETMDTGKNKFYCSNINSDIYMDDDGDFNDKCNDYGYIYPFLNRTSITPDDAVFMYLIRLWASNWQHSFLCLPSINVAQLATHQLANYHKDPSKAW